jgi:ribosomal protein L2
VYLFGGSYDRGRDVHNYSQRGVVSRAAAHPSGGGQRSSPAPARSAPSPSSHSGGGQGEKR